MKVEFLLTSLLTCAVAHMWVVDPPSRQHVHVPGSAAGAAGSCPSGICFWFNQACTIGCPKCGGFNGSATCPGQQGKETLPDYARTYWYGEGPGTPYQKKCGVNPWCAPGSAPVMSPCGVGGGDINPGGVAKGGNPPWGFKQGYDSRDLPELSGVKTTWKVGSVAEIQWAIIANHGGGYQYRLCPKSAKPTEECFQKTPLKFYGNTSWIQWVPAPNGKLYAAYTPYGGRNPPHFTKPDPKNRTAIPNVQVSTGTIPEGSTWMRNPVPSCKAEAGGAFGNEGKCKGDASGYQFPPPIEDKMRPKDNHLLGGFGAATCYGHAPEFPLNCGIPLLGHYEKMWDHMLQFNIVDKVVVPDVPPGEYIISGRFDCEQSPQIWNTCFDVTIEGPGPTPAPTPMPTPPPAPAPCVDQDVALPTVSCGRCDELLPLSNCPSDVFTNKLTNCTKSDGRWALPSQCNYHCRCKAAEHGDAGRRFWPNSPAKYWLV